MDVVKVLKVVDGKWQFDCLESFLCEISSPGLSEFYWELHYYRATKLLLMSTY